MSASLDFVAGWIGDWVGTVERRSATPLRLRNSITPVMEGRGLMFEIEAFGPETGAVVRGVRLGLAEGPDRRVQCIGYSTEFGVFGLEQTPDDDDVLALSGVTENGMQLNVTYSQESAESLQVSVFWRPHGTSLAGDGVPGLLGSLRRNNPWKPGPPSGV